MAKSSKRVDIFYVFIGHKHLRDVRQCFLAACGCLYEQYRMILIWRWCAQQLSSTTPCQPTPHHLNLTPPHSYGGRFTNQNIYFISFVTFQQNKLYHFFFCVMMIKAILMKWPPPGTEIMRMQGENSRPRCNSRHLQTLEPAAAVQRPADLSLTQDTSSEPPAGHWHDTISGGPSSAAFVSVQIIIFRSDRISSV